MPGDSKKNDKKNPKEQRKLRQRQQQQAKAEIKPEKPEEHKSAPNVTVPQKPPVYESPPPEFYKNLKRETDEILKITEEENSKYKKKEIQSNWSKYEMPIETYDEIDEQENLGADYEKLIAAPLSAGGHFQFKHERSWDMNTGPSQYDKYFEINMEDLNIALCTIPFYERNYIEQSEFSESDILSMNNRCTRFKQKYFNDKSYAPPESEVQDKILNSLRDSNKNNETVSEDTEKYKDIEINMENEKNHLVNIEATENNLEVTSDPVTNSNNTIEDLTTKVTQEADYSIKAIETSAFDDIVNDDFIFRNTEKTVRSEHYVPTNITSDVKVAPQDTVKETPLVNKTADVVETKVPVISGSKVAASVEIQAVPAVLQSPVDTKKNPVIESPEDLEKWLDDFLDG